MSTEAAPRTSHDLGPSEALPDDFVVPYYVADIKRRISVARLGGRLYAFDDLCTCAQPACPLSGGLLNGAILMCQCHGSQFDVTTGAVVRGPATQPLQTHQALESGGRIQISVATD